jgi:hypothetical protein
MYSANFSLEVRSKLPSFPLLPDPMVKTLPSRSLQAPTSPVLRGANASLRLGNLPPRPPLPPPSRPARPAVGWQAISIWLLNGIPRSSYILSWDRVDPLLIINQLPCSTINITLTKSRSVVVWSSRTHNNNFANRVGKWECPSVTSRPVVNLSVVPTSSPEGILGEPRSIRLQ